MDILEEEKYELNNIDDVDDLLGWMLETHNPYSETLIIKSDGNFAAMRLDGCPIYAFNYLGVIDLYAIAQELQKRRGWHFSFETDPEGQWVKYTVLKK